MTDDLEDTDGDGLTDGDEVNYLDTDPNDPDTDGDGLVDGLEVDYTWNTDPNDPDTDDDGLTDALEFTDPNNPGTGFTEEADIDTDVDGLTDGYEQHLGTDPTKYDSDNDGVEDGEEVMNGSDPNWNGTCAGRITPLPHTENCAEGQYFFVRGDGGGEKCHPKTELHLDYQQFGCCDECSGCPCNYLSNI